MATLIQIQIRRDTAANWSSSNPILLNAEPGYETDSTKIKYGDGATDWNNLPYWNDISEELTLVTGEVINADRVIVNVGGLAFYFDPTNNAHYRKVVGISRSSVGLGVPVGILVNEQIVTGLSLTAGSTYFASSLGQLTTTPVAIGISQPIGIALNTTDLLIQIQQPTTKI